MQLLNGYGFENFMSATFRGWFQLPKLKK